LEKHIASFFRVEEIGSANQQVASKFARWFAEPTSSTLKIEEICSSETSVETQRTARRHIQKMILLKYLRCWYLVLIN
jgi:hypothetical protein